MDWVTQSETISNGAPPVRLHVTFTKICFGYDVFACLTLTKLGLVWDIFDLVYLYPIHQFVGMLLSQ